ncbi:RING-H2 finger protein ATL70-like [Juglans microcarpa x Juglans regia]|uniref:RING-H2 finger protein ATL70-like n=1 Tax=Juglans microcarpa x Juglans regia TaxID=2249226 RepID=UPI001B7F4744|nr:RING-H2 finger protein ATL70-like [Juglans microcarpa x Juglans regia]
MIKVSSTVQYGTDAGDGIMSGFTYGIIFFVGVFLLILLITFACTRLKLPDNPPPPHRSSASAADHDQADPINIGPGLHEFTVGSYPKLLYSETTQKGASADSSCAICLVEYKEKDMLRLLPDCEHLFHLSCIDPWMRLHPTCPICRRNISDISDMSTNES